MKTTMKNVSYIVYIRTRITKFTIVYLINLKNKGYEKNISINRRNIVPQHNN